MDKLSLALSDSDRIDDLPRAFTYRRQRALEAAESRNAPELADNGPLDVTIGRLTIFFLKCAIAVVPALCLLTAALWVVAALSGILPGLDALKMLLAAPAATV
ncbi:MAG: hypothetical protein R3D57_19760 [Hyphomicrobiaceae bacterium]